MTERATIDVTADPALADLAERVAEINTFRDRTLPSLLAALHDRIRTLKKQGYPMAALMAATGYSDQRIFQIARAGREPVADGEVEAHA